MDDALDPRPSVTVAKTVALNLLLTLQLTALQSSYAQQAKDNALLHKEVQNEYDTKYVRPATHRSMRDAGTQCVSHSVGRKNPSPVASGAWTTTA